MNPTGDEGGPEEKKLSLSRKQAAYMSVSLSPLTSAEEAEHQHQRQHQQAIHPTDNKTSEIGNISIPSIETALNVLKENSSQSLVTADGHSAEDEDDDYIPVEVKRWKWTPPPDAANNPYKPHQGEGSQYLRDFILGVNDGLVSTFLLVVGFVGGNATTTQALLGGIAQAIAGALSMGIGEFVATKSQLAVADGEYRIETEHFKYHRDVELNQLRQFLASIGLEGNLQEAVVSEVGRDDEALMKMMQAFEFGGDNELERNPFKAMLMSGRLFLVGSLPTLIPFFATNHLAPTTALGIAAALVGVTLFLVGMYKTKTTNSSPWLGGVENLVLGGIATGISYAIGAIFNAIAPTQVA